MTRKLALPDELYDKLAKGAAQRGLTLEGLLGILSDLVVMPLQASVEVRQRSQRIEEMLARYAAGQLSEADRDVLDQLINEDYEYAIARADWLIAKKKAAAEHRNGNPPTHTNPGPKARKQARK